MLWFYTVEQASGRGLRGVPYLNIVGPPNVSPDSPPLGLPTRFSRRRPSRARPRPLNSYRLEYDELSMIRKALHQARSRLGSELLFWTRRRFASGYLLGEGLEIGALHSPFRAPHGASVTYVDRLDASELRHHYPELSTEDLVEPDIVDDAELLSTVPSASQDFVIASHVLEHCENPIGAIKAWLRVLRAGGVVLLVVPDKRFTIDRRRRTTGLAHFLRDSLEGPQISRREHYLEWVQLVEGSQGRVAGVRAAELEAASYSIHFHTWDFSSLQQFLVHCTSPADSQARLAKIKRNRGENLALLQRN